MAHHPKEENLRDQAVGKSGLSDVNRGGVFTCMLVAPVVDSGGRRPISSGQEESRTLHSEEAFADAARARKPMSQ